MAANKPSSDRNTERDPLAQRGEKQGAQDSRQGGDAEAGSSGQAAQSRPGGSAPGGQSPDRASEHQEATAAQGDAGEPDVTQHSDARRRSPDDGNA
jgi:hypothetical protein